jgi:hypothetical protein
MTSILGALVAINRETDANAALLYARKLADVVPDDPGAKRLLAELEAERKRTN